MQFNLQLHPQLGILRPLRRHIRTQLADACNSDIIARVQLVLSEAVQNIVTHGFGIHAINGDDLENGTIEINAIVQKQKLKIIISDDGPAISPKLFCPNAPNIRRPTQQSGFGLIFIRTLVSQLHYHRAYGRNHLELVFDL